MSYKSCKNTWKTTSDCTNLVNTIQVPIHEGRRTQVRPIREGRGRYYDTGETHTPGRSQRSERREDNMNLDSKIRWREGQIWNESWLQLYLLAIVVGAVLLHCITLNYHSKKTGRRFPCWHIKSCFGIVLMKNCFCVNGFRILNRKEKIGWLIWSALQSCQITHTPAHPSWDGRGTTRPISAAFVARAGSDTWRAARCLTNTRNKLDRFVKGVQSCESG